MVAIILVLLLIVALIAISVFAQIQFRKGEKQRTKAMSSLAAELNWEFYPAASAQSEGFDRLALTELTSTNEVKNMMYGEVGGIPTTVFDYIYTRGAAKKHPTTLRQTVILFEPEGENFPEFTLRPEGAFDKMFSAFGYQDIDFNERPEFSRQYILRGQDETAIRRLFSDRVFSFYLSSTVGSEAWNSRDLKSRPH